MLKIPKFPRENCFIRNQLPYKLNFYFNDIQIKILDYGC